MPMEPELQFQIFLLLQAIESRGVLILQAWGLSKRFAQIFPFSRIFKHTATQLNEILRVRESFEFK